MNERMEHGKDRSPLPLTDESLEVIDSLSPIDMGAVEGLAENIKAIAHEDQHFTEEALRLAQTYSEAVEGRSSYSISVQRRIYAIHPRIDFLHGAYVAHEVFSHSAERNGSTLPNLSLETSVGTLDELLEQTNDKGVLGLVDNYLTDEISQRCGQGFVEKVREQSSLLYSIGAYTAALLLTNEIERASWQ